jgi:hypothetical protein
MTYIYHLFANDRGGRSLGVDPPPEFRDFPLAFVVLR